MKVLYLGDIMGRFGRQVAELELPKLRSVHRPDVVLAQAENATQGRGISRRHYQELRQLGIDGFMSGNHIFSQADIRPLLDDPNAPITQPANYPDTDAETRFKLLKTDFGDLALVTLMGQIVGKDADVPILNPLRTVDAVLEVLEPLKPAAVIVNFHGDYSSEKVIIGQYLDGKVSAVIGDHWHVPTADAQVLPGGTAHISDVGMVGSRDSSLGVKSEIIINRWHSDKPSRNELEESGRYQFCAVVVDIDDATGSARSIEQVLAFGQL